MSNGLGAGFAFLTLLGVLVVLAGVLAVTTAGAVAFHRYRSRVPTLVLALAAGLLAIVVAVAGFGLLALVDEAPLAALVFGVLVGVPLVLVAGRARLVGDGWLAVAATAGLAWWFPFLVGVGVLFGFSTSSGVSPEVATAVAGVFVSGGTLLAGEVVRRVWVPAPG